MRNGSRIVRFPVYIEAVGYEEMELPDWVDASDEDEVKDFIEAHWDEVCMPDEYEPVEICGFDMESVIEIFDAE